jgi:hypothetical protein
MKNSVFAIVALTSISISYSASHVIRHPSKAAKTYDGKLLRINMTGPNTVSRTGGPYTFTVNLSGFGQVAQGSVWTIRKSGSTSPVYTISADETATGTISIEVYGSNFGSTGSFTVSLTSDPSASPVTIYGSKGVTVS